MSDPQFIIRAEQGNPWVGLRLQVLEQREGAMSTNLGTFVLDQFGTWRLSMKPSVYLEEVAEPDSERCPSCQGDWCDPEEGCIHDD